MIFIEKFLVFSWLFFFDKVASFVFGGDQWRLSSTMIDSWKKTRMTISQRKSGPRAGCSLLLLLLLLA
jgi:hypothetical protein